MIVSSAFVETLKQLSPDEAKILTLFQDRIPVPIVSIRSYDEKGYFSTMLHNFSVIAEQTVKHQILLQAILKT